MDNKAKIKVLVLLDKKQVLDHGINLGDTSLSFGLYDLIQNQADCELISGGWKNFPYLNYKRLERDYKKSKSIQRVLQIWFNKIELLSKKKDAKILKYLLVDSFLVNNSFIKSRELITKKKYNFSFLDKIRAHVLKSSQAKSFVSKIYSADLVIFSGGGNLRDHNKTFVPGYLFEMYLAKMLGKKVIASNYTLCLNDPLLRAFAKPVFEKIDFNLVREPISKRLLIELGIQKAKIDIMPDSAFGIDLFDKKYDINKTKIQSKYNESVGINLRGDKEINIGFWEKIVGYIREKHKLDIYFFYTCRACDKIVFKQLAPNCEIVEVAENLTFVDTIALIKKMKFIITDRYHAAIFSIMAGTPFLPVNAKTHKIAGLTKLINYPLSELAKEKEECLSKTKDDIDYLVLNHDEISDDLKRKSKQLYHQAHTKFSELFKAYL